LAVVRVLARAGWDYWWVVRSAVLKVNLMVVSMATMMVA
jgi:hypothetical protein